MIISSMSLPAKIFVGLILLHCYLIGLWSPSPAAEATIIDGVPHVLNSDQPRDGQRTLKLQEAWRVGGDDDEAFFGLIPRVDTDAEGNVYVLDSQLSTVSVYDRDGDLLRTLFREGEGPGEVIGPRDMFLLDDGRVGLVQDFPGVVVFVDKDGTPAGRMNISGTDGGIHSLTGCLGCGDKFLLSGTHHGNNTPGISDRDYFLERYTDTGDFVAQYAHSHAIYDFNNFVFSERQHIPPFWFCYSMTPDGTVYSVPDRDKYAINVHQPDGTLTRVIERDYEPLQRTDKEYDKVHGMIESAMGNVPFQVTIEVERQEAAVANLARGLQMGPDGRLWVLTGRGASPQEDGIMAVFDVFEPGGEFAEQVALKAPHKAIDVGIVLGEPGRILVILSYYESLAAQFGDGSTYAGEDEEVALPAVICYDIVN